LPTSLQLAACAPCPFVAPRASALRLLLLLVMLLPLLGE
jgi:hypothetical protein